MKIHFFCARNIEDYRKIYRDRIEASKSPNELLLEDFEQKFFLTYIKKLFKLPQEIWKARIFNETGIEGLRFDFNFGLRLDVPEGNFRVKISDAETGQIFFDKNISDVRLLSFEQYFIHWRIEVFLDGAKVFEHTLNLAGQKVMIAFIFNALGDLIALLPFVREFKRRHGCELSICLHDYMSEFVAQLYPEIPQAEKINFKTYATYYPLMLVSDYPTAPTDMRNTPLNRMAGAILGLNIIPPKPIFRPTAQRICREPYVCVGVQASMPIKGWLYPNGWEIIINYLKSLGYRVFCIDKEKFKSKGNYSISMPTNAEDFTGDFSIMERANMLYHAEFFIGLSSGLSWVADVVNCPVVMICGFSQDWFEFYTPYRVANRLVCNGCLNDIRVNFIAELCPYHKGTARELECQKKISPRQVINVIERLIIDRNLTPPILRALQ